MSETTSSPPVVLHIWPKVHSALSFDPQCTSTLIYLQLAIPGQFSVAYCSDPDQSPSGQLPFLTHGQHSTSGFDAIVKYVVKLLGARNLDAPLTALERAQSTARIAQVESIYGDLVSHTLYATNLNWWQVVRPTLTSTLPVPQRYYVPGRLRDAYKTRLVAAEFWGSGEAEQETEDVRRFFRREKKKKQSDADKTKKNVEREKVLEKARLFLDSYARLLGGDGLLFSKHEQPSSLDVIFAAHTHVLLALELPDHPLKDLLQKSYPSIIAHATLVYEKAFPDATAFPPVAVASVATSLKSLVPWPKFSQHHKLDLSSIAEDKEETHAEEAKFRLARWAWAGVAVSSVFAYLYFTGLGGIMLQASGVLFSSGEQEDNKEEDREEEEGLDKDEVDEAEKVEEAEE